MSSYVEREKAKSFKHGFWCGFLAACFFGTLLP